MRLTMTSSIGENKSFLRFCRTEQSTDYSNFTVGETKDPKS